MQPWLLYSLGSGFSFAIMALAYKKVFSFGISPFLLNLFAFGFAFLVVLGINVAKGDVIIPPKQAMTFIILGTLGFLVGNTLYIYAVGSAPNPGYATALKATDILFATFLAFILFRSHLSLSNVLGVFLIIIGVFLVAKK